MLQPGSLQKSGRMFLLVDGAKIDNLAQVVYTWSPDALCDSLYRSTELAEFSDISPWLVEAQSDSALGQKCFEEWQHLGSAIVLQANCTFDDLMTHLRGLLKATLASGDEVIFRFYDPEILRNLLSEDTVGNDRTRLMGPCMTVAIQDRRTGEWQCFQNDTPSHDPSVEPFSILDRHLVAMEKAARITALRNLELHTAQHFPHLLKVPHSDQANWANISGLMSQAQQRGLSSTRDIALYINTIGWLGLDAFQDEGVQKLWQRLESQPDKAIAFIAGYAEKQSREGRVHG